MNRFLLFGLVLGLGIPLLAQDRMPKIPDDRLTQEQKKAAEQFHAEQQARAEACRDPKMDQAKCTPAYYEVHGRMVPLERSPEIMLRANALDNYLEFKTVLPPKLRELVILMAARQWTNQYVWNSHYTSGLKHGLSQEIVDAVAEGRRPRKMSDDEDTVYEFFDELHRTHGVSDATYTRALVLVGESGHHRNGQRGRLLFVSFNGHERGPHAATEDSHCPAPHAVASLERLTAGGARRGAEPVRDLPGT